MCLKALQGIICVDYVELGGGFWYGLPKYAGSLVTKPPKPGFVGFGIIHLADFQDPFSGDVC
jgi:hypothetical protein